MYSRIERLLIALVFALLAAGVTLVAVQAQEGNPPPKDGSLDCATCHTEFHTTWMSGPHGNATTDPAFLEAWDEQGNPGACLTCHVTGYNPDTGTWDADGVTCQACHGEAPADHPNSPMPVDYSADTCGRCHSDTRFGWQEWELSTHYRRGMDCTVCHDPHSAALKQTVHANSQPPIYEDASDLCITCHKDHSTNFPYSVHNQKGVSCIDCHIMNLETDESTAHTIPDHSFNASLSSCNDCHADQMHQSGVALQPEGSPPDAHASLEEQDIELASVTPEPGPVSPIGFAGLAALIGLAAGMVLAPWLERFYQRTVEHVDEEPSDE